MTSPLPPRSLPERISFPEEERKTLQLWEDLGAFKKSLELSKGRKPFTFYDGPPFATGLPHHGHLLAGTIKDTVTRFAHQTGHYVERRFGWDCHGLPVESEVNKKLGVTTKEQVLEMGIAKYNDECRSIVQLYTKEWERTVQRIGRWIDCENDYKTMEPWYMESVWHVFQALFNKGLVYRGYKILPYSTACTTSLSNFEANSDYRDTPDPSVVVSFPLVGEEAVSLLAWTTTPWTLPANLALCVNESFDYVKVKDVKSGQWFILAESRLAQVYPKVEKKGYSGGEFEVVDKFKGSALVGQQYEPLFDCFATWPNAFRVLSDTYVTDGNGTGVVHQAPTFGEDDYRICVKHGVCDKFELPDPLDANGRFTDAVPFVEGLHVKEADDVICKAIKDKGRLVSKQTIVHSYPFCYRSGTPLIYRAVPGWFVNVEQIRDRIVANNQKTYWVPAFVKEKRFHNWLADGKDWNISRGRFWGTPMPLWVSDDYEEIVCVGSVQELEELSGVKLAHEGNELDLHREFIDHITIPSKQGKGVLRRVEEVFDCWFESGSMPYAQQHYPFENKDKFEAGYPADFIAEGLDQTRGWFYTLMVISTALFDKPAFQNVIVNGLVLADGGHKMSKSLRNYTDPTDVFEQYGADALRLYLINSPVVRAEPFKFVEGGVQNVIKDLFLPWFNAARFFAQNAARLEDVTEKRFVPSTEKALSSTNVLDAWVLAALHNLIKFVRTEMAAYRLYTVVPRLVGFIDQLTKWYVRLNRPRLKGSEGNEDTHVALSALYEVLYSLCKLMAPFTPFFAEYMYQFLRQFHPNIVHAVPGLAEDADGVAKSVHFLMVPDFDPSRVDERVEATMKDLQTVIELGRVVRERRAISLKNPVNQVVVMSSDAAALDSLRSLETYIHDELNMRELVFTQDEKAWCVLRAEANVKTLGRRLGKALGDVREAVTALPHDEVSMFLATKSITVEGYELAADDVIVKREFKGDTVLYEADVSADGKLVVVVDTREDDSLKLEGTAREFITRTQKLRKKARLVLQDKIHVYFDEAEGSETVTSAIKQFVGMVASSLGTVPAPSALKPAHCETIISEKAHFSGSTVTISVTRPTVLFAADEDLVEATNGHVEEAKASVLAVGYAELKSRLGDVSVQVKGETVTLTHGVHWFLDASDLAAATKQEVFLWLMQA